MIVVGMTLPYHRLPLGEALAQLKEAGYRYAGFGFPHDGHEIPSRDASAAEIRDVRETFLRHEITPYTLYAGAAFSDPMWKDVYIRRIAIAAELGIPFITDAGVSGYHRFPDRPKSPDELAGEHLAFVAGMREIAKVAEDCGVTIVLKPHTGNTATARELNQTLSEIGSETVQAYYDPGNVRYYEGVDPASDIERLHRMPALICAKDHSGERGHASFPVPGEGDVNFKDILGYLFRSGYDGPVVVERVDGGDRLLATEETTRRMRRARHYLISLTLEIGYANVV